MFLSDKIWATSSLESGIIRIALDDDRLLRELINDMQYMNSIEGRGGQGKSRFQRN